MTFSFSRLWRPLPLLSAALLLAALVYWPGLYGGWLFDDYPNIVDNRGVQPQSEGLAALLNAALSSPASEFKRPLASLTFALNYVLAGLDPFWMKLTNLVIHLLNGVLVFLLARRLLRALPSADASPGVNFMKATFNTKASGAKASSAPDASAHQPHAPTAEHRSGLVATLIATGWLLLPINLTAVLYVVQRMESLANLFVLAGLIGYVAGRQRMLASAGLRGFWLSVASITLPTGLGLLAKETAVLLPLYALAIEWVVFRGLRDWTAAPALAVESSDAPFVPARSTAQTTATADGAAPRIALRAQRDWRVIGLFVLVLGLPMLLGLGWLLPQVLNPVDWTGRNFTLVTRLLSELRIVVDYIGWTLLPWPDALSFYHDDYLVSTGWLSPWTTTASALVIVALLALMVQQRRRRPALALGLALFFAGQSLTATILPLELIYEHRNYFASFGLLFAVVPWLLAPADASRMLRRGALIALLLLWGGQTLISAYAWGDPLRLAELLAARAPDSPRAQYELGRTYIMYSHYDQASPYTRLAYAPLERAASLPDSSILPQQALIFMNSRMGLPLKDAWWDSMIAKLAARPLGVQDDSSLAALTDCARDGRCNLPSDRMTAAFEAALRHPRPSARVLATYADYAWSVLGDHPLGLRMIERAVAVTPNEPAYHITLGRMLLGSGQAEQAQQQVGRLKAINVGGRLDKDIHALQRQVDSAHASSS